MSLNKLLLWAMLIAGVAFMAAMVIVVLAPYVIGGLGLWLVWRVVLKPALLDQPPGQVTVTVDTRRNQTS